MQPIDTYRKTPTQARSQASVDAILEATSQILQDGAGRSLTTNAIAQRAGVSIGTLYQYFPDKNAILIALARKELSIVGAAVQDGLAKAARNEDKADPLRITVRALIKGFHGRHRTRKLLIEALIVNGLTEELARPVDKAMNDILAAQAQGTNAVMPEMTPITAYVLTRAIVGTLRAALMEESAFFGTPEFEDELVKLAHGLLAA